MSGHLPGSDQTSVRAELYAALAGIIVTTNELHIRTDYAYVHINLCKLLKHRQLNITGWNHRDLWKRIQDNLNTNNRPVEITKVKGHATFEDVDKGTLSRINMYGNHAADKLATDGAALVTPDKTTHQLNNDKFRITATQQIRIFNILKKRWNLCKQMGLQNDDKPSTHTSHNSTPPPPLKTAKQPSTPIS